MSFSYERIVKQIIQNQETGTLELLESDTRMFSRFASTVH